MKEIHLRKWQAEAVKKSLNWFADENGNSKFLLNVAPGAGKTICASVIASQLLNKNEIERVVVIAPRTEVVRQWSIEFQRVVGETMMRVTGSASEIANYKKVHICTAWQSVENLGDQFQKLCQQQPTLVICDEYHHAAIEATWGIGVNESFADAKYRILLSGTPIRTDGAQTVAHDGENGIIDCPDDGTYTMTYGEAVQNLYCRPATFHRHEGKFDVVLEDEEEEEKREVISVSGKEEAKLPSDLRALKDALNFYKLACTPKYLSDGETPDANSYQASMLEEGIGKLNEARDLVANAGGLVIAHNIKVAECMKKLLDDMGEDAFIVHSKASDSGEKIKVFRDGEAKWLVSVGMISEGVDIKRLRVLVYLPKSQTELTFRQSMGRVIRTLGPDDISSAYIVMPNIQTFEKYALRVEEEMHAFGVKAEAPKIKICPQCDEHNSRKAKECKHCGHKFPERKPILKACPKCERQNSNNAKQCQYCGVLFDEKHKYEITLREALRVGAIIRGMELDEDEVKRGEEIGSSVRDLILKIGNEKMINLIRQLPVEAHGRLEEVYTQLRQTKDNED